MKANDIEVGKLYKCKYKGESTNTIVREIKGIFFKEYYCVDKKGTGIVLEKGDFKHEIIINQK